MENEVLFRIVTEDRNRAGIVNLLDSFLQGYTLIDARGVWNGEPEDSLIIEWLTTSNNRYIVDQIARQIKISNDQQAVLVQEIDVRSRLI